MCRRSVVVRVRLLGMAGLFLFEAVVVAVGQRGVVVVVRVPVGAVLPLAEQAVLVMVSEVIVIVRVNRRGVRVLPNSALGWMYRLGGTGRTVRPCRHRRPGLVHRRHSSSPLLYLMLRTLSGCIIGPCSSFSIRLLG